MSECQAEANLVGCEAGKRGHACVVGDSTQDGCCDGVDAEEADG